MTLSFIFMPDLTLSFIFCTTETKERKAIVITPH